MAVSRAADPATIPALLKAAQALFYEHGLGPTGVDDIAVASGLTKPTLYRHFPSKEALVAAYLDERNDQLDHELRLWVDRREASERPRAVIDWICNWISQPGFNGCAFVRAQAELPGDASVQERARARKRRMLETIESVCRDARAVEADALAQELALIVEGATTMAFVTGNSQTVAAAARRLGQAVLDAARFEQ